MEDSKDLISRQPDHIAEVSKKGDTIYRVDAIDAIGEDADWCEAQGSDWQTERKERDFQILIGLPSAQPEHNPDDERKIADLHKMVNYLLSRLESQWIPCSERLPEESGRYLISVLDGVGRRTTVAPYQPRYKAWTMTGRMAYWKIVAWMPLPEPWKEGEEG